MSQRTASLVPILSVKESVSPPSFQLPMCALKLKGISLMVFNQMQNRTERRPEEERGWIHDQIRQERIYTQTK